MEETRGEGTFPFKEQPGEEIGRGIEFRVLKHNDGWVVKEGIHPEADTLEQLKMDKEDHTIMGKHIGKFLPETHHIRGHTSEEKPGNIIRQREISGRPLYDLSDEEINDDKVRSQLVELFEGCAQMWDQEGRVPDLYGPEGSVLKSINPRYARNIIVEDETDKVWLVDTSANVLVFSKKAMLRYKPHLAILRRNMNSFIKKLKKDVEG